MKKKILILLLMSFSSLTVWACDICGCGIGNNYIGILPDFQKQIFGVRYRYNSMLTHVGVGGSYSYLTTRETYNTVEAWGGWNIGEKFRVMASVPYNVNKRVNQGVSKTKNGLGDISLSGYYQLINNRHPVFGKKLLVQSLWVGGGVKLATGKYDPGDKNATNENANLFQLGTGSYDFTLGTMYDIRLQDAGVNISANYKITTANKHDYQYGNKFNINTQAYYKIRVKDKFTISPNAGLQYERAGNDLDNGIETTISGGNLLLGTAGVEAVFGKLAIGANFQTPFSQHLANGIVRAGNRAMLHLSIAF